MVAAVIPLAREIQIAHPGMPPSKCFESAVDFNLYVHNVREEIVPKIGKAADAAAVKRFKKGE